MDFAVRIANDRRMPLSLCLGIGSSQGAHIGKKSTESLCGLYFPVFADFSFCCNGMRERQDIITQAALQREKTEHWRSFVLETAARIYHEFWGEPPVIIFSCSLLQGKFWISALSTGGGDAGIIFCLCGTRVKVNYVSIGEADRIYAGGSLIIQPVPGIWRIFVRGREMGRM